jgi:hypothetical protein
MSFSSGSPNSREFEHAPGTASNTLAPSYRDMELANRKRALKERERAQGATVCTFLAPSDNFTIKIGGVEYNSRKHARFGFVIDLPVEQLNERFQGVEIPFGKKGEFVRIGLIQVREESGITF